MNLWKANWFSTQYKSFNINLLILLNRRKIILILRGAEPHKMYFSANSTPREGLFWGDLPAPRKLIMHVSPGERIRSRGNSKKRPDNSPGRPLATNYSEHVQLPDVKAQVGKVKARPEFQPCQSGEKDFACIREISWL